MRNWRRTFRAGSVGFLAAFAMSANANAQTGSPVAPPTSVPAPQQQVFPGSSTFTTTPPSPAARNQSSVNPQGEITLNFINADVNDVVRAVMGDYLDLNYVISPNVKGAVTIQTSKPLQKNQVLPVLEQVLRLNGVALILSNNVYQIVPNTEAHNQSGPVRRSSSGRGYGIQIVPVRYISAEEMLKLLTPLAPSQGIIHVDKTRNLLIIEGTAEERQTLVDDVALFDADYLGGMSFAMFAPTYLDASELAKELTQILGGLNSPVAGLVRLVPIDRLNVVLAISPQARYLDQLQNWVTRLDHPSQGSDKRLYVYHVQNGRAADLSQTLTRLLFGGSDGPSPSTASDNQLSDNNSTATNSATQPQPVQAQPSERMTSGNGITVGGLGNVKITADEVNNAIVFLATPRQYAPIEAALRELDVVPLQVFLEAAIAEVSLTNNLRYGVQYLFQPNGQNQFVLSNAKTIAIGPTLPGFSYMFQNGSDIKVVLDALSSVTHVEVVSSPQLLVLNNQTATLQVGNRVPVATQQAVSVLTADAPVVNSIQYQDTGVILKVTPRVNRGGLVMMDIAQEVSEVSSTTVSALNSPTIQQRKVSSSVAVQDGDTIALAGLITNNRTKGRDGIPLLQDIPLLGNLFRATVDERGRTELIVLITPHVVDSSAKARAVTEELRHKLPAVEAFLADRK